MKLCRGTCHLYFFFSLPLHQEAVEILNIFLLLPIPKFSCFLTNASSHTTLKVSFDIHIYCNIKYKCILILLLELKKLVRLKLQTQEVKGSLFWVTDWDDFIQGTKEEAVVSNGLCRGTSENKRKRLRWYVKEWPKQEQFILLYFLISIFCTQVFVLCLSGWVIVGNSPPRDRKIRFS